MPFAGAMNRKMQSLAGLGRGGDTALAHLTPGEIVVPQSITELYPDLVGAISEAIRRRGRNPADFIVGAPQGPLNPHTGMEEFGLGGDGVGGGEAGDSPGGSGGSAGDGGGSGGDSPSESNAPGTGGPGAPGGTDQGGIGGTGVGGEGGMGDTGAGFGQPGGPSTLGPTGVDLGGQGDTGAGFGQPGGPVSLGPVGNPDRDREGFAGGPGAPRGQPSSFSQSNPSPGITGLGGPRGATRADPGAAVASPQGFFESLTNAFTNPQNPGLAKGLSIAGAVPGLGPLGAIGRGLQAAFDTVEGIGKPAYDNPIGGTPGSVESQAVAASPPGMSPDTGFSSGGGGGIVASAPAFNQGALQAGPGAGAATPIPAPAAQLTPQEAAQVAEQLGVSNDPLQARAQIATYALNANGAEYRTAEAAALWETLLAQSYSPSPGLLDIERQYMAEVLGYGAQAYEGEDETARALAQTGAPIRRAENFA